MSDLPQWALDSLRLSLARTSLSTDQMLEVERTLDVWRGEVAARQHFEFTRQFMGSGGQMAPPGPSQVFYNDAQPPFHNIVSPTLSDRSS